MRLCCLFFFFCYFVQRVFIAWLVCIIVFHFTPACPLHRHTFHTHSMRFKRYKIGALAPLSYYPAPKSFPLSLPSISTHNRGASIEFTVFWCDENCCMTLFVTALLRPWSRFNAGHQWWLCERKMQMNCLDRDWKGNIVALSIIYKYN